MAISHEMHLFGELVAFCKEVRDGLHQYGVDFSVIDDAAGTDSYVVTLYDQKSLQPRTRLHVLKTTRLGIRPTLIVDKCDNQVSEEVMPVINIFQKRHGLNMEVLAYMG